MFLKYDKKDKKIFIILHGLVLIGIIIAGIVSIQLNDLTIYTVEERFKIGTGVIIVSVIVALASLNVIKNIFKFKSLFFVITALILFLLKNVIDLLFMIFFTVSIPLLFNDLVVQNYFNYLNMTKYFDAYKFMNKVN